MSTAMQQARDSLDEPLRPVFDELVENYRFEAYTAHGHPWVSYKVLAKLVETGWRRSGEAVTGGAG